MLSDFPAAPHLHALPGSCSLTYGPYARIAIVDDTVYIVTYNLQWISNRSISHIFLQASYPAECCRQSPPAVVSDKKTVLVFDYAKTMCDMTIHGSELPH